VGGGGDVLRKKKGGKRWWWLGKEKGDSKSDALIMGIQVSRKEEGYEEKRSERVKTEAKA